MPKIMFEVGCSFEEIEQCLKVLRATGKLLSSATVLEDTERPVEEPAPTPAEEPKPAKKSKKKAEEAPAKAEEPKPAEKPVEPAKAENKHTLDDVRKLILQACEKVGTATAIEHVAEITGVRKAAQIDAAKYAALVERLNMVISDHEATADAIG